MELTPSPHLVCGGPRKSRAIPLLSLSSFVAYKKCENLTKCEGKMETRTNHASIIMKVSEYASLGLINW